MQILVNCLSLPKSVSNYTLLTKDARCFLNVHVIHLSQKSVSFCFNSHARWRCLSYHCHYSIFSSECWVSVSVSCGGCYGGAEWQSGDYERVGTPWHWSTLETASSLVKEPVFLPALPLRSALPICHSPRWPHTPCLYLHAGEMT